MNGLAQTLTIDITLCGDYAGIASLLEETCGALVGTNTWWVGLVSENSADRTSYTTYVINDASTTYANAYVSDTGCHSSMHELMLEPLVRDQLRQYLLQFNDIVYQFNKRDRCKQSYRYCHGWAGDWHERRFSNEDRRSEAAASMGWDGIRMAGRSHRSDCCRGSCDTMIQGDTGIWTIFIGSRLAGLLHVGSALAAR